jgi:gamma-tubulin complex component 3
LYSNGDDAEEVDAAALWEAKFLFRAELVPTFLAESFARKIFSAGKSLNFIRYSCGDSDWKDTRQLIEAQTKPTLRYADLVGLERTIDTVHATVSKRLLDIFLDKFKLQEHLRAINDYLLLTKGDFADLLLEALSPILYKQASLLYRHSLTAALETAIRGSNAQYDDADILRRLDARVLEFSGTETGWETFMLEYRVDSPVNTVLDATAMSEYQQIFAHLWKMKRVELCLNASFAKMISATNSLLRIRKRDRDDEVNALHAEAHRGLGLLAEMIHFMRQLQGYNQLEVIEYSWQDLQSFFEKRSGDLDVLIAAHRGYLSSLHGKILLRGGKRGAVDYLASELRANFNTIIAFTQASDELATFISDELARRHLGDMETEDTRLRGILRKCEDLKTSFRDRTDNVISRLERHGNLVSSLCRARMRAESDH